MNGAISIRYQPKIRTFVILIWGSLLFGGCFENPTLPGSVAALKTLLFQS